MVYLITLGMIFILSGCTGLQPVSEADITVERVVEAKGSSKDIIYESTKMWIAENFRSAKAVLEYENKEAGKLIGNGSIKYPCSGFDCMAKNDWRVLFTMRVDVKDDKFRLTFTNLRLKWPPSYNGLSAQPGYEGPIATQGALNDVKPVLLKMGDDMVSFLGSSENSSDW